jgi:hypothetical protein
MVYNNILSDNANKDLTALRGDIVRNIFSQPQTNIYSNIADMVANSLRPRNLDDVFELYASGINNENNINSRSPSRTIYSKQAAEDIPYSLTEAALRKIIYIPCVTQE